MPGVKRFRKIKIISILHKQPLDIEVLRISRTILNNLTTYTNQNTINLLLSLVQENNEQYGGVVSKLGA
jgi:hypothetical protein